MGYNVSMGEEEEEGIGFETGFCHFCRYETKTKRHGEFYFCVFCEQTSVNDRKSSLLRVLNWGLNYILKGKCKYE